MFDRPTGGAAVVRLDALRRMVHRLIEPKQQAKFCHVDATYDELENWCALLPAEARATFDDEASGQGGGQRFDRAGVGRPIDDG